MQGQQLQGQEQVLLLGLEGVVQHHLYQVLQLLTLVVVVVKVTITIQIAMVAQVVGVEELMGLALYKQFLGQLILEAVAVQLAILLQMWGVLVVQVLLSFATLTHTQPLHLPQAHLQ